MRYDLPSHFLFDEKGKGSVMVSRRVFPIRVRQAIKWMP